MNDTTINTLNIVAQHLNIRYGSFLLIIGNLGCLMNIFVFRSKSLHKTSFSVYFLATTCADFILLNFVLLTRILQNGFLLQIVQTNEFMCKLRGYLSSLTSSLSFSFFVLISIDRYFSTHSKVHVRTWGNRYSLAIKLILCLTLFWMIISIHRFILYNINPETSVCELKSGLYWWYRICYKIFINGLAPQIIVIFISTMIIRNIRLVVNRRTCESLIDDCHTKTKHRRLQKLDHQLTSMLLIQSTILFVSFLPYNSELLYTTLSRNLIKSDVYLAWENVFIQFIHLSSYVFYSTNGYIFLATNQLFRRCIIRIFRGKESTLTSQSKLTFV